MTVGGAVADRHGPPRMPVEADAASDGTTPPQEAPEAASGQPRGAAGDITGRLRAEGSLLCVEAALAIDRLRAELAMRQGTVAQAPDLWPRPRIEWDLPPTTPR